MLINKWLLDNRLILVRSTNTKFLKYLMDLDMTPIVKVYSYDGPDNVSVLRYYNGRWPPPISHVWIHPLTVKEIKQYLNSLTNYVIFNNNIIWDYDRVVISNTNHKLYNTNVMYIDRNRL